MSLRVKLPGGQVDAWQVAADERHWFDYSHQVVEEDLVVFLHTFRRVRERADHANDALIWKHHTTKMARRYAKEEWAKVTHVRTETPPKTIELVAKRGRSREPRGRR